MTVDAVGFFGTLVDVLWIALVIAVGVWVLAAVWVVARLASRRLEDRYLPVLARWSRRRAGLEEDSGPWACPICHSVNPPTVTRCYGCGVLRPGEAPELHDAATDETIFHRPPPTNRFDPSLYRGPGAPLPTSPEESGSPVADASPEGSPPGEDASPEGSPPGEDASPGDVPPATS